MRGSTRTLAAVFGLCLLGTPAVAASATRPADQNGCGSGFSTCSALMENSFGSLGAGKSSASWQGLKQPAAGAMGSTAIGFDRTAALGRGCGDPSTCVGGPGEPPIVTPEPVTMALLATGLAGIGGIGLARRRREQRGG